MVVGRSTGGSGGGTVAYQQPYALADDCLLSEDHFLIQPASLDPATDQIIGYPQTGDFAAAAMLVQDGVLSNLYHDPAQNYGTWAIAPVTTGSNDDVIRQVATGDSAADSATPVFAPAVPLQPGIAQVAAPESRATGTGLIAMGTDGSLLSLLKDPASGAWLDSQIHLPATEPLQVTSYRVQLTLTDASGRPVTGESLQVSCASPTIVLVNSHRNAGPIDARAAGHR